MSKCSKCVHAQWSGGHMGTPNEIIGCKIAPQCWYKEDTSEKGWK